MRQLAHLNAIHDATMLYLIQARSSTTLAKFDIADFNNHKSGSLLLAKHIKYGTKLSQSLLLNPTLNRVFDQCILMREENAPLFNS